MRSTDQGGLSTEKTFTITVTNVNESPTDIALSSTSIAENAGANATVGTLSTTDPDAGNTFTYTLVAGIGDTDNSAFNISGSTLRATSSFDFETKSSYTIRVRSTDLGGLSTEKTFTITVTNVNESPTDIALSSTTIAENAGVNAIVGSLSASDPDFGESFAFSLPSGLDNNDLFNISGTNLRANASFDFEAGSNYTITVRVTDLGGLTYDEQFPIVITNVDERPVKASVVTDINRSPASSWPTNFTTVNGIAYFTAVSSVYGSQLWKTDGTESGTLLVKNIEATWLTNVDGILYFRDQFYGLWKTEGTEESTVKINDPSLLVDDRSMIGINGELYFSAAKNIDGAFTGFELWKSNGTEEGTVMVKDIFNGSGWSNPANLTNVNGILYFVANDGTHGNELWKSDGTEIGTVMVRDINTLSVPASSSNADSNPTDLTNVNGTLYFAAGDNAFGTELWKSDGTEAGTVMVQDISEGNRSSSPHHLTNVNGSLYFSANDGTNGYELWQSNGTAPGTSLVKDINNGPADTKIQHLTNVNGTLYFAALDNNNYKLWKSTGSELGTVLVKDIPIGMAWSMVGPANRMANIDGTLYFQANDGTHGYELWKTDGSEAGTVMVADINADADNSWISELSAVNGKVLFRTNDHAHGYELWSSNGSESGTLLLTDINASTYGSSPDHSVNVNGTVYFTASNGITGTELWKTDGTDAGTFLVKDIFNGSGPSNPANLTNVNGILYFTANDVIYGEALWKSDGTEAGTMMVKDVGVSHPRLLTNVNGTLYFVYSDGIHGEELWKSDGTEGGTIMVKDIVANLGGSSAPQSLTAVNNTLYFTAYSSATSDFEVWKTDGTDAGTVVVNADASSNNGFKRPSGLTNVNGILYFLSDDGFSGDALWKSDGTESGTVLVKEIPGQNLIDIGGTLYFTYIKELWKSDGSESGTVMVKDIEPGGEVGNIRQLTNVNGVLYFSAFNSSSGSELWKSDGTESGTFMVKDIRAGSSGSYPYNLTNLNGTLYFQAYDSAGGNELWKSDGTETGTVMALDLVPGPFGSVPQNLLAVDDSLYFTATTVSFGSELWKLAPYDGNSTDIALSNAAIPEDASIGTLIGNLTTIDPDTSDTFTYTFVVGDGSTNNSSFTIEGDSLKSATVFNFEDKSSYSIRVRSTDQNGMWIEKAFTVGIADANEAPTSISLSNSTLPENSGSNAFIGSLSASDPDTSSTFTFSLPVGIDDNAYFNISATSLRANNSFDFESKSSYTITVRVTDQGGLHYDNQFTITVTNVSEAPVVTTNPSNTTVVSGGTASFNATAIGDPTPSIQWQANAGSGWANIPGANSSTYSFTTSNSDHGKQFRAIFTNGIGTDAITSAATLTVNYAPAVTANPSNTTVLVGNTASFTAAATGNPTPTVKWQVNSGTGWVNIIGATNTTFTFTTSLSDTGKQYRAVFTNGIGSDATTSAATLTVATAPAITSANAATFGAGLNELFQVTATGTPSPTYSVISGALPTGISLNPSSGQLSGKTSLNAIGTYTFTIQASNGFGTPATQNFTLTVANQVTGFEVSKGSVQRSYLRYVDVPMLSAAAASQIAQNASTRVRLLKADLNGNNPTPLALTGQVSSSGTTLAIDFGAQGISNSRNGITGDGYYTLQLDLDSDGVFDSNFYFYRLFGDTNGDRKVDQTDINIVTAALTSYSVLADLNFDGRVNSTDLIYVRRSLGRALKSDLPITK